LDLLAPLADAAGTPIVLKMRSHANHAPAHIVSVCRERPKTLFVIRHFPAWAASRFSAFNNPLEDNLKLYLGALAALRWLRANTDCLVIRYEQLIPGNTALPHDLAAFLGLGRPDVDLAAVFARDAQAGIAPARDNRTVMVNDETRQAIAALWASKAPRALLEELGLGDLG
jgi:hypothetical protein